MSKQIQNSAHKSVSSMGITGGLLFMLKSVVIAYCISVVLLFFTALLATFNAFSDTAISIAVNIVTALSVTFCGFMSGRHFDSKGLIFGALCGILYSGLLCLLGILVSPTAQIGSGALTALTIGLTCGSVGGIVGINTKRQRRR